MQVPVFISSAVLFLLHQAGCFIRLPVAELLDGYLDPLLLMPIALPLVRLERRLLFNRPAALTGPEVIALTISVSFICELIFPLLSPRCVGDLWDLPCYFAGSAVFLRFMNPGSGRAAAQQLRS